MTLNGHLTSPLIVLLHNLWFSVVPMRTFCVQLSTKVDTATVVK